MGHKLAIDFGTTNSVVASWNEADSRPELLHLPLIGTPAKRDLPPLTPSLVYVHDGEANTLSIGQAVRDQQLDLRQDNRLFRNFKRGIVTVPAPEPRPLDGVEWADATAGRHFLRRLIEALPYPLSEIDQLVLTAPVASFEGYLSWLNSVVDAQAPDKIHIVDESTAAALGYMVTKPGAVVLVFDFGGGTLDLSLVELPESRSFTGGLLRRLLGGSASKHTARVIAKAGRVIGGSDVDQWLLAEVLNRTGVTTQNLGADYARLLTECERAKIALSNSEVENIHFESAGLGYDVLLTRTELEQLLEDHGFYVSLRRVVDKVMHVARQRGIFKEDIHYVLLVGGTSLMPSVQNTLKQYFTDLAVRADKPFSAVAEGALLVAAGYGLEDYLAHSYGLRYLDLATGEHQYDEIIPMGSRYPTESPIEVTLGAAHTQQQEVEFIIGEIDTDSVSMIEVRYEDWQAVFVAQANSSAQQIALLNEDSAVLAKLLPSGEAGKDRLKAEFRVDERRQLRLTVTDIHSQTLLLQDVAVTTLH